jgi:3-dehydroquinate dehydratase / shikimate dehydrogenase
MIIAIVAEKNLDHLLKTIQAFPEDVDVIELRLDFLTEIKKNNLKEITAQINKPYILTLRSVVEGGHFQGSENQRLAILYDLMELKPTYVDVESLVADSFINKLHQSYPAIKIIRSYHHFSETPENLDEILSSMLHPQVSVYKIVTYANTALDNLRVLHFLKQHTKTLKLVTHCMGPLGLPSRIMGAALGNYFTYASMPDSNTPVAGCPDVHTLINIYAIKKLNQETKVFALLGNPVEHSIGHLFHNKKFSELSINAVYLKIQLNPDELTDFFKSIKTLPFYGFSVTMPLKETILPYLDTLDRNAQAIGAANTVSIRDDELHAINTDGVGALDAIESKYPVEGRHVLMIGAGGAAKAIAHACYLRQPASLTIVNRTLSTAKTLAEQVNGTAYDIHSLTHHDVSRFDVVINTIPNTDPNDAAVLDVIRPYLSSKLVFMNIDYLNKSCLLLTKIRAAGCITIDASTMFTNQALRQIDYWFPHLK